MGEPQHLVALRRANAVRTEGATIKRLLADGKISVADALVDERARRVMVVDLVRAQPRWGRARATRLLASLGIPELKRVRHLTGRQRAVLIAAVERVARETATGITDRDLGVLAAVADATADAPWVSALELVVGGYPEPVALVPRLGGLERRGLLDHSSKPLRELGRRRGWRLSPSGRAVLMRYRR